MAHRDRRTISFLLSSISFVVFTSCQSSPEPSPQSAAKPTPATRGAAIASVSPADAWFGYADETGSHLLMLQDDGHATDQQAKAIRTAVCSEGRELFLRYIRFQSATAQSDGRQNARNLKNDEGHLFSVEGAVTRPGDTCLLLPAGYVQRYPLARNEYPETERRQLRDAYRRVSASPGADVAAFQARDDFARATVARIERETKRKVRLYWLLHRAGAAQQVAIVEFEPEGDSLLASLVVAASQQIAVLDIPADRKNEAAGGGCWPVDDGCLLNQEEMDVPVVLGRPGETLVFYTAGGPEGQSIRLLQVKGGELVDVKSAYRYQSPL